MCNGMVKLSMFIPSLILSLPYADAAAPKWALHLLQAHYNKTGVKCIGLGSWLSKSTTSQVVGGEGEERVEGRLQPAI